MNTRREQVQAHRFVTRRLVSAMLSGEPETNDLPMRRLGQALFASAMVGVIVLAVIGVIGAISGGGGSLGPRTLVVEKETGAKFVYDPLGRNENMLYPVANYASAKLIVDGSTSAQRTMSHSALRDIPRGPELGIPNAPDAVPTPDALLGPPWSVCDLPAARPDSVPVARAVIGIDMAGAITPSRKQGLLVATGGQTYLLYDGRKLLIGDRAFELALNFNAGPVAVTTQLLNSIPSLAPMELRVPDAGQPADPSPGGRSAVVGQVFRDDNQYYLMRRTDMVRIGEPFALVRLAALSRDTHETVTATTITVNEAGRYLARDGAYYEPVGYPLEKPTLLNDPNRPPRTLCARYDEKGGAVSVRIDMFSGALPAALADAATRIPQAGQAVVSAVDQIVIPGGRGVLVAPAGSLGASTVGSTVYLVTDDGIKYPLARSAQNRPVDAVEALGYQGVTPLHVPIDMLDLLPTGVTLDYNKALLPVERIATAPSAPDPAAT